MNGFLQRHADSVTGMLSGFDRIRFRGTIRLLANASGLGAVMSLLGVMLKDFKTFAEGLSEELKAASLALAMSANRPVRYLASSHVRKEDVAREIARQDKIERGLICVLTAVEPCWSFHIRRDAEKKKLVLETMATVEATTPLKELTQPLCRSVTWKGRSVRGLNPLSEKDALLLEHVGRGEFILSGFRNRDLRDLLFIKPASDPKEARRRSGQVTRMIRMLRAHGLIHKVAKTHRYLVSPQGRTAITALLSAREANTAKLAKAA